MDEAEFWGIIETGKDESDGTFDGRADALAEKLATLSPDETAGFERVFTSLKYKAYTWDLWGAAYVIGGGCSDDGFSDFRSWLISMGRHTFENAIRDPESLVDVEIGPDGEEDSSFEEFAYVAARVYEEKTGKDFPIDAGLAHPDEPSGEAWDEDAEVLAQRFPKLSAKYGDA